MPRHLLKFLIGFFVLFLVCTISENIQPVSASASQSSALERSHYYSSGSIKGNNVPIYRYPETNSEIMLHLSDNYRIYVMEYVRDANALEWYKIRFEFGNSAYVGYVDANCTNLIPAIQYYSDLSAFPADYQPALSALQASHPNWTFVPLYTGLDWETAVTQELTIAPNNSLVTIFAPSGYWNMEELGTDSAGNVYHYDWRRDSWYHWQPEWYAASRAGLSYCMDPRNFLNERSIFMFEEMSYGGQDSTMVEQVLSGTFMNYTTISDTTDPSNPISITYADLFVWIGEQYNINPIMLASRVRQEQGLGTSPLISGVYPGYEGLYNYFNMGATGHTNQEIITNGLKEAQVGSTMELPNGLSYTGPWNSRVKAIIGGALKMASIYLDNKQDTLYLQKFDVDSTHNGVYWHQYMQNIQAPISEAAAAYKAYSSYNILNGTFVFKIPVYNNMNAGNPEPGHEKSSNNYLVSLQVDGVELMAVPDKETLSYSFNLSQPSNAVTITAASASASASITGTGSYPITSTSNTVSISVTAENGSVRTYTLLITAPPAELTPVSNLSASVKNNSYISVSWDAVNGAEGYAIYRREGNSQYQYYTCVTKTVCNDIRISVNTPYSYRVYPYRTVDGKKVLSSANSSVTATLLSGPSNLKVSESSSGIRLTWDSVENADAYIIYRRIGGNANSFSYLYITKGNEYLDSNASFSEFCFYRVYPYYIDKNGQRMTGKSESYVYGKQKLASISGLSASSAVGEVKISWDTVPHATGYMVYRKQSNTAQQYIGWTADTSFTDDAASTDTYNFYWVRPCIYADDNTSIYGPLSANYVYSKAK